MRTTLKTLATATLIVAGTGLGTSGGAQTSLRIQEVGEPSIEAEIEAAKRDLGRKCGAGGCPSKEGGDVGHDEDEKPILFPPGTYTPGQAGEYAAQFCFSRMGAFERTYRNFVSKFGQADWEGAFKHLQKAFDDASRPTGLYDNEFSALHLAFVRGKILLGAVTQAVENETDRRRRSQTIAKIMYRYVSFVIREAVKLDSEVLLPFWAEYRKGQCTGCGPDGSAERNTFQGRRRTLRDKFVGFAQAQLKWVQDTVKYTPGGTPDADGSERVYLALVHHTSSFAADDLASPVFTGLHGCAIYELEAISRDTAPCVYTGQQDCISSSIDRSTLFRNTDKFIDVWEQIRNEILPSLEPVRYNANRCDLEPSRLRGR